MNPVEQLDRTILLCRDHVFDGLTDEEICAGFMSLRVLCVSDLRNLSSFSGQTALVTVVSLLSRMGMQVELAIPEVPLIGAQPPMLGASLCELLIESSEMLVTGATVGSASGHKPHVIFALGDTEVKMTGVPCWRLIGGEWCGTLAMDGIAHAWPWKAQWTIGAMTSAALASSEAFKFAMRNLRFRNPADLVFFEKTPICNWNFGSIRVPEGEIDLGCIDLISAGAICQSLLYALLRLPRVRLSGRVYDDDLTAASNLNRNMLTKLSDVGSAKVRVAAQSCGPMQCLEPIQERFLADGRNDQLADRVLVGVDDIPSRWAAQRRAAGWLAISGTSHFNVSSSAHAAGTPCSGCLHPVDDPVGPTTIPTVSFVSFWAGLAMAVRLIREVIGRPYPPSQQHLWLAPLRMDHRHAAMWQPVAAHRRCPVSCRASQVA